MVQTHHVVDGSVIFAATESTVTHFFVGSLLFLFLAKARYHFWGSFLLLNIHSFC